MAIINPYEWTTSYVKNNEYECVDVMERFTGAMQEYISDRDYLTAAKCCNTICEGLSLMAQCKPDRYAPMLYSYSYILAAIPPLQDALDFARDCAKPGRRTADRARRDAAKIENMLRDLQRGVSVETIRRTYCPDFPNDILNN